MLDFAHDAAMPALDGRENRVFKDMSVFDILDVVLGSNAGRSRISLSWRFDIAERGVYPKRSLTTQYQENDLAFAERLMQEEGLFYFFERGGDPGGTPPGRRIMVIADQKGACQADVRTAEELLRPVADEHP